MDTENGHDTKDFGSYSGDERGDFALKDISEGGTFTGYASVFSKKDLENEIVEPGAFKRTLEHNKGRFPLLWQHDKREVIGSIEEAKEDLKGLQVKGRLSMGVQRAKDAYALLKDGVIRGMSIGFKTIQDEWERKTGARHLKEIRLHEVSLVTFAANPHALVTSVKAVTSYRNLPIAVVENGARPWSSAQAQERVRAYAEAADSDEERKARMDSAYLYRPRGSAPRLLIADVFGDELRIDPRAIDQATAEVFSEVGNFAKKDLPALHEHLDRYHERLGIIPPWHEPDTLEAFLECAARLIPYASEESQKALSAALGNHGNTSSKEPFKWPFPMPRPDAAVEALKKAMAVGADADD